MDMVKMDYKKIKMQEMMDYIMKKHQKDEETLKKAMKAFAESAIVEDKEKDDGSKTHDLMKAKKFFYETYKDEIEFINAPKGKGNKQVKIVDELMKWL